MKRKITDPILLSNSLFLMNALLYAHKNYMMCFFCMFLVFLTSGGHHYHCEKDDFWNSLNIVATTNALFVTLFYITPYCDIIDLLFAMSFLIIALLFKQLANDGNVISHVAYHIFIFCGQCYLWYILDYQ